MMRQWTRNSVRVVVGAALLGLSACGNSGVGPGEAALIGSWEMAGQPDPTAEIRVEAVTVRYDRDGTSDLSGRLVVAPDGVDPASFALRTEVDWTLEETVLTRILREVSLTPETPSEITEAMARQLEAQYATVPPGRLIVQTIDDSSMTLLDVDTGEEQTFRRLD